MTEEPGLKIEHGIPMSSRGRFTDLANKMGPGDSVFLRGAKGVRDINVGALRRAIVRVGGKSLVRSMDGGVRVWRITP